MMAPFTPRPPIDEDQYRDRIPAALAAIHARGNLLNFEPDRAHRLALLQVLSAQGLICWNRVLAKYELTAAGNDSLAAHQDNADKARRKTAQG